MLKLFTTLASKYAYLRTFKKANFMILPTLEGSVLVKGIKMMKILKFVPNFANLWQQLGQSINFHSYTKMRLRNMLKICLVFRASVCL